MNYLKANIYYFSLLFISIMFMACQQKPVRHEKDNSSENAKKLIEMNRALVRKDRLTIKGYVKRNNLEMKETGTGLWYSVVHENGGEIVKKSDLISIAYVVTLLDGVECYSSKRDGVKTFVVGQGGVESGLEEGVLMMHVGDKARFIMPPHLAHGLIGDGNKIPERAIIIYEVELLSIQQ